MSSSPLDVLVVSYGDPELLERCIRSVQEHLPAEQVRVWDNHSAASTEIRLVAERHPQVDWTFSAENIGFAAGVNRLVEKSDHDTLLLNPDAILTGPLTRTRAELSGPRVAAVSPAVIDPTGHTERWDVAHRRQTVLRVLLNHAGYAPRLRRTPFSDLYPRPPYEVDGYITACSLLVSREAWREVGPLDERFFLYGEDPDWQRRARARGWRVLLVDEPDAGHVSSQAVGGPPPIRGSDLRTANTAVAVGIRGGRGPGNLVLAGGLLLGLLQRSKRRNRQALAARRALSKPVRPDVVVTVLDLDDRAETRERVALAGEFARRGHPVTVVCLEGLGDLQRTLDPSVRMVLRPWWLPVVDKVGGQTVLITGDTVAETRFGTGRTTLRRRSWLVIGSEPRRAGSAAVARGRGRAVVVPVAGDPAALADACLAAAGRP